MKYWLYENKRITGPLDADILARRPGFSARSLVCPADKSGQAPSDWVPAGTVPDFVRGPSQPPAPPVLTAPEPPGFNEERVSSELEGLKRMIAALEMRLRGLEEAEGRLSAKAASQHAALQERLTQLSDTIAAQDVRSEAIDAALAALRSSIDELRLEMEEAEERFDKGLRQVAFDSSSLQEDRAEHERLSAALRDGLAGMHRLLRALETRLDSVAARSEGMEAAHAAQKADLVEAFRKAILDADTTRKLNMLHDQFNELSQKLLELQRQGAESEKLLAKTGSENAARLEGAIEALAARLCSLEPLKDQQQRLAEELERLDVQLQALDEKASHPPPSLSPEPVPTFVPAPEDGRVREGLERASEAIARLEAKLTELESRPAKAENDPRLEGMLELLGSLKDRVNRLEAAQTAAAPQEPRLTANPIAQNKSKPATLTAVAGALAAAVGFGLWYQLRPAPKPVSTAPAEPAETNPTAIEPIALPLQTVPASAPEQPPATPAADSLPTPEQAHVPTPAPWTKPPSRPLDLPEAASPPASKAASPKRARAKGDEKIVFTRTGVKTVAGEVQLLEARLLKDGVILKLSEPLEPTASFSASPPRLTLDFAKAPSKLPPKDLGSMAPHILQLRIRESDSPARLLWAEIQLDKAVGYRIENDNAIIRVRFDIAQPVKPPPALMPGF